MPSGGHAAERCFITGTPHPERGGFRNWVSLDQYAAEQIGNETRYPSLVLAMSNEGSTLSYTGSGAPIPSERSPRKLFEKLFHQGNPEKVEANVDALRQGRSMLDFVGDQSHRLNRSLSKPDQSRMDEIPDFGARVGKAPACGRGLGIQTETENRCESAERHR